MPTEITRQIDAWKEGRLGWRNLVSWLVAHKYDTPTRYLKTSKDIGVQEQNDYNGLYDQDGTWDEVNRRNWDGTFTREQYAEILKAAEAAYPTGPK